MGIDNIPRLKPKQRPRCSDWNTILEQSRINRPKLEGKKPESMRRMTQFYTDVAIPPYSIFPLIPNATDNNHTFNATYTVEQYKKNNESKYMPGYFGANGRMGIPAGSTFLGYIMNSEWDTPVKISDSNSSSSSNSDGTEIARCGFQDNSWEATIESSGLIINGSAPQGNGIFYCRLEMNPTDPLLCASKMPNTDTRPQGGFELDSSDTWLYADSLNSFGTENDDDPPKVANPCGYPEDRPVIVGKVQGFSGGRSEEESTGSNGTGGSQEQTGDGENEESGSSSGSSSSSSDEDEEADVDLVAIACDTREFFMINNGSGIGAGENPPSGNPGIYKKGSLHYIKYDSSSGRWIPANEEDEESTGSNDSGSSGGTEEESSGNGSYNYRLAVCQRDMPAGWNVEFRMPYYAPEMNLGAEPDSNGDFIERCGVQPGEYKFSKKRLDYHFANRRYSYEPRFVFVGQAVSYSGGVGLEIEGETYEVRFPTERSTTSAPDVYADDTITVEVDARGDTPILKAIDFPMDFPKGTIIASYSDLTGSPYRGWEDITDTKYAADIGNSDLLVLEVKAGGKRIADYRTHQCTCSNSGGGGSSGSSGTSGGGGTGHTCPHDEVTTAKASFRWYRKIKGSALI